ncbi:DVUA0089 family protein [Merismopedia glauca]|nr:DVUA0089 family protein [Merismopedia glauca]
MPRQSLWKSRNLELGTLTSMFLAKIICHKSLAQISVVAGGAALLTLSTAITKPANAADFSFRGSLNDVNEVQLFNFSIGNTSNVTLKTLSYAGGVQADGTAIANGGFDPILSLFDGNGNFIADNDDGSEVIDPVTGRSWDSLFASTLNAGHYTVAVSMYPQFRAGNNLSDGFRYNTSGGSNFGDRTSNWAFDVLNADYASNPTGVPEPTTILGTVVFGTLGGRTFWKKRKSQKKA